MAKVDQIVKGLKASGGGFDAVRDLFFGQFVPEDVRYSDYPIHPGRP